MKSDVLLSLEECWNATDAQLITGLKALLPMSDDKGLLILQLMSLLANRNTVSKFGLFLWKREDDGQVCAVGLIRIYVFGSISFEYRICKGDSIRHTLMVKEWADSLRRYFRQSHNVSIKLPSLSPDQVDSIRPIFEFAWLGTEYHRFVYQPEKEKFQEHPNNLKDHQSECKEIEIDGQIYEIGFLSKQDIPTILGSQTVTYQPKNIEMLVEMEPFCFLNRCIRHNGVLVSWCLTHLDFSTGLIGTEEPWRGKGLGSICVKHVLKAQLEYQQKLLEKYGLDPNDRLSLGFVHHQNESSRRMMLKCGYRPFGPSCYWAGININQD